MERDSIKPSLSKSGHLLYPATEALGRTTAEGLTVRLAALLPSSPLSVQDRRQAGRSLPISRLPGTNPANFLECRFWITFGWPTIRKVLARSRAQPLRQRSVFLIRHF